MKNKLLIIAFILSLTFLFACSNGDGDFDATGTFESEEIIVSSEAMGKLVMFKVEEGMNLKLNDIVGVVDTTQLHLKKKQLLASVKAVLSKQPDIATQLASLQKQIETAETEQTRINNLVKSNAATTKQLDDINSQLDVLRKQYNATKSSLTITKQGLQSETLPLTAQIEQIEDQIKKSYIINPVDGTCLLYTSDAADERSSVDLGGRRIIKKKHTAQIIEQRKHIRTDK